MASKKLYERGPYVDFTPKGPIGVNAEYSRPAQKSEDNILTGKYDAARERVRIGDANLNKVKSRTEGRQMSTSDGSVTIKDGRYTKKSD